jgi:RsiW-degrading membrane proteinase PrsW (M82 family)
MNFATLIIAILTAFVPAVGWVVFYARKDYRDPEPMAALFQTFLAGAVVAIPFLGLRVLFEKIPDLGAAFTGISAVFLFAVLEEVAKLVAAIFVVERHRVDFDQVIDGVVYAVTAALGFAFVENVFYFIQFLKSGSEGFLPIFLFRSFGTMLAHTLFSGVAGLVWAYAYFSKQIAPFSKKRLLSFELEDLINHEILTLHILRSNVLLAKPSRRGGHEKKILVMEGMVAASLLHASFNLATTFQPQGKSMAFLLVPTLMAGIFYSSFLFTKKMDIKILRVV